MQLSSFVGNELRRAFGAVLHHLFCTEQQKLGAACEECQDHKSCLYGSFFDSRDPNGQPVARPYILEPLFPRRTAYNSGEALSFNLLLIGQAVDSLGECLRVFQELGQRGLGRDYWHGDGRFHVEKIQAAGVDGTHTPVYESSDDTMRLPPPLDGDAVAAWTHRFKSSRIGIHFSSPLYLRDTKPPRHMLSAIEFHHLWDSLQNRLEDLMQHQAQTTYLTKADFKALKQHALTVRMVESTLHLQPQQRRTSKQQVVDMGGLLGYAAFEGEMTPFSSVLAVGEWLHSGHGCDLGNGRYSLALR